jgi:hypothetical protein
MGPPVTGIDLRGFRIFLAGLSDLDGNSAPAQKKRRPTQWTGTVVNSQRRSKLHRLNRRLDKLSAQGDDVNDSNGADFRAELFQKFDLSAIARTRDGRLLAKRYPSGHESAWWLCAADVGPVLARARADGGDVPAAARAVGVRAIEHSQAVQRAESLVDKLNARLRSAQQTGALRAFNVEYREKRLAAFREGKNFMSYSAARSRLKKALVESAASKASPGFIRKIFD